MSHQHRPLSSQASHLDPDDAADTEFAEDVELNESQLEHVAGGLTSWGGHRGDTEDYANNPW